MAILYQWQTSRDDGNTWQDISDTNPSFSGVRSPQLVLRNLTVQDHLSKIRAYISYSDPNVPAITSRPVTLFTIPTASWTHPQETISNDGTAVFNASVSLDRGQVLSYQWQKRTNSSTNFINIVNQAGSVSGANTPTLSLSNLTRSLNNNNQFRLVVMAKCCGTDAVSYSSDPATLFVSGFGQTLVVTRDPVSAIISSDNSITFSVTAQTVSEAPSTIPPSVVWQVETIGGWADLSLTGNTTSVTGSGGVITWTNTVTIPNVEADQKYRAVVSDGTTTIESASATVYSASTNPNPCSNCGGSGSGDPHYFFGNRAGFDDNKPSGGSKEIVMLYVRDKNTDTEYVISVKNTGAFRQSAPYSIQRVSGHVFKNKQKVQTVSSGTFSLMGVASVQVPGGGRWKFSWDILRPENLGLFLEIDIEMGGVWYWMLKSYIEYARGNTDFTGDRSFTDSSGNRVTSRYGRLGWPYIGWISADGISMGLAPYGLSRRNFEMNDDETAAGNPEDMSRFREIINPATVDDMRLNSSFWIRLSNVLQNKPPDTIGNNQILIPLVTKATITEQPTNTISTNGTATFRVETSKNTTFQWQKQLANSNVWNDIPGAITKVLTIQTAPADDKSKYRVLIEDRNITSSAATLTVARTIKVTQEPTNQNAVNLAAQFGVVATGVSPLVYTWQKSTDQGKNFETIVGENTNILSLSNLKAEDDGSFYRVIIDDGAGDRYTSGNSILSINPVITITQQPINSIANDDEEASFIVQASCNNGGLLYRWQTANPNSNVYTNIGEPDPSGFKLSLSGLKVSDNNRKYRVQLLSEIKSRTLLSNPATLSVPSSITIDQQPTDQVYVGGQAIFSISAGSTQPPMTFLWQYKGPKDTEFTNVDNVDGDTITITGATVFDDKTAYRVILEDTRDIEISNIAYLSVPASITINSQPSDQLSINKTATFSVSATSDQPPLSYQWQIRRPNEDNFIDIYNATSDTFVAENLGLTDDNTEYRVVLKDDFMTLISDVAKVDTTPQITITEQPAAYIPQDYKLSLSVNATTTNGELEYSWRKSEPDTNIFVPISGQNSRILELDVTPADSGTLYKAQVFVSGAIPKLSDTVKINIPKSISLVNQLPITQTVNFPNKNIVLSIEAETTQPPLLYQWQKSIPQKIELNYTYNNNDIFYDQTELFLPFDGENNSKSIVDLSKNALSGLLYVNNSQDDNSANVNLSTSIFKQGSSSCKFGERGSIRISDPDDYLKFDLSDFTIECWYYPTSYAEMAIMSRRLGDRHPNYGAEGWVLSPTRFRAKIDNVWSDTWINDSANLEAIPLNEWTHVALSRRLGVYRLFRNGSLVGEFSNSGVLDETSGSINIGIAKADNHEWQLNGYIDQLKITKGVARYTKNFNPEAQIDTTYSALYDSNVFADIPGANSPVLELVNLGDVNNSEKYRVVLSDRVSSLIVEDII